ncbi:hypothetical protein RUM44_012875 [Polyplax serrata]|uniref:Uncharacterized protein n=1 Tax=Polyplax serrata TaxID=468196 RepID=A0ABR1BG93_POLSC
MYCYPYASFTYCGGFCAENAENDGETEEADDRINGDKKDSSNTEESEEESDSVSSKIKQISQQQTGGTVLAQSDISSSQLDFFKMLDEKIENGPDYEESDEEEQKTRMTSLVKAWKAACLARQQQQQQQQNISASEQEQWMSPGRSGKPYQEDYHSYPGKRVNVIATQRFPTGYTSCPPSNNMNLHLQNSYRVTSPYVDQPRMQPRIPVIGNYHPFQPPLESYNSIDPGQQFAPSDPLNAPHPNSSQILLRQSSLPSQVQVQHYPENQRLYSESIRQFSDFSRTYQDPRPYQITRPLPTINVLYEHRMFGSDVNNRPHPIYQDDARKPDEVQRVVGDMPRQYMDAAAAQTVRPSLGNVKDQRIYHERLFDKQRQYIDGPRPMEGPRAPVNFQQPPLFALPQRVCRESEGPESSFPGHQGRFPGSTEEASTYRPYNPSHFKGGRSLSVEVHYLAGPPPPREMIPLQGAPGPPQCSPRPQVPRGLQPNMHRLPNNSAIHFRKPQGAFT